MGLPEAMIQNLEHALYLYVKNYTAGHAKDAITHGMANGVDAWRKLIRDQLPLGEDKRGILMTEFMSFKAPVDAKGLRSSMIEIERTTDNYERLTSNGVEEEFKVGKMR